MNTKPVRPLHAEPDERPFFFFLSFVLIGLYAWSVASTGMAHQPLRLALFTTLMVIHLALHWAVFLLPQRLGRWEQTYLLLQGIVAFAIIYLGGNIGMLFGLYMALIGESIGMLRKNLLRLAVFLGYYILLTLASYYLMMGPGNFGQWALFILPTALFVSIYVLLYSRQTEARERAVALAAELETANRHLSEYAERVEDLTIANERQRMARELHDTLSQGLAGLILQLEATDAHLAHDRPGRAREIIQDAMEQARITLSEARRVIGNLREQAEALPLDEAVRHEAERFMQATGIPCEMHFQLEAPIPEGLREPILRIITEALTNIGRHAQATEAGLRLSANGSELCAEVWDNGLGFDPSKMETGHYGLLGMRERARLAGGRLEVQSEVGNSTRVVLYLPLTTE